MGIFLPTERDKQLIQETIRQVKRLLINHPSRPPTERSWDEAEDHQAPEIYIAKPTDAAGIPGLIAAIDTAGTGTAYCDDYDTPGSAFCDIYKIQDTASCGPGLFSVGLKKRVYNLSPAPVPQDWIVVKRDKFGRWIAEQTAELAWCMLAENHPGRGIMFQVWVGTWCPEEAKFRFPCDDATAQKYCAIDWHYDVPTPAMYAQGWFRPMPYTPTGTGTAVCEVDTGMVYVNVSMDCSSDDNCANHALPCQ